MAHFIDNSDLELFEAIYQLFIDGTFLIWIQLHQEVTTLS